MPAIAARLHQAAARLGVCTALAIGLSSAQAATLAQSTFEAGADGWLVKDLPFPAPGAGPTVLGTAEPTAVASGGHPGGYVTLTDISANTWYWFAPAKFLGTMASAYGGTLSFDMAITGRGFGNPPNFTQEDVLLVGAGKTLTFNTGKTIQPTQVVSWLTTVVPLSEAGWTLNGRTGPAATQADLQSVLGSLSGIYLRGEYLFGLDDTGRLDNVILTAVPEPASIGLFAAGLLALAGLRSRRRQG